MHRELKAPFPWFGGKSRVAKLVWDRIGDVDNYCEPFCGSAAMLLGRPHPPRIETLNDADCYVANFWRATSQAPELVAEAADWPVNEADLHARHRWLVLSEEAQAFRQRMRTDPDYFDPKIAGWWCWGLCAWIGSGWCVVNEETEEDKLLPIPVDLEAEVEKPAEYRDVPGFPGYRVGSDGSVWTCKVKGGNDPTPGRVGEWRRMKTHLTKGYPRVNLGRDGKTYSRCVHRLVLEAFVGPRPEGMEARHFPDQDKTNCRLENLSWATHTANMQDKKPRITSGHSRYGNGVHAKGEGRPQLADAYSRGRGVHNDNHLSQKVVDLSSGHGTGLGQGILGVGSGYAGTCAQRRAWLLDWFNRLRDRLRTVRVCCGDWTRVCSSDSVTVRLGTTGVFLDPPYSAESGRDKNIYSTDCLQVAHQVRKWCLEWGKHPQMRIALCGYAGEGHEELESLGWQVVAWKASGGYGNRTEQGKENTAKERIWFSPACINQKGLFDSLEDEA